MTFAKSCIMELLEWCSTYHIKEETNLINLKYSGFTIYDTVQKLSSLCLAQIQYIFCFLYITDIN